MVSAILCSAGTGAFPPRPQAATQTGLEPALSAVTGQRLTLLDHWAMFGDRTEVPGF